MDQLANLFYLICVLLLAAGVIVFVAFRGKTVDEARSLLAHLVMIAVTWPYRFLTYRSGHGVHAT
jgi:hypothetical protein